MKIRSVVLGFIFILPQCLIAQSFFDADNPDYLLSRIYYRNSSGENGTTWLEYDPSGKLSRSFWSLDDGTRFSENSYQMNEAGKVISIFRKYSDSIVSHEMIRYDATGKRTEEWIQQSDNRTGSAKYFYTGDVLDSSAFRKYKAWLTADVKYYYKDKRLDKAELFRENKLTGTVNYSYDIHGNRSEEYWDFNGQWNQHFRYTYIPRKEEPVYYMHPLLKMNNKYRIKEENYSFQDKVKGPSYYYYDASGKLLKKEFIRSDGYKAETFYQYDVKGRIGESRRKNAGKEDLVFVCQFNAQNQIVERTGYIGDSMVCTESYMYLPNGRLWKAIYRNVDFWLTGTIDYQYHPGGFPESAVFRGGKQEALIRFRYDEEGLLREIDWKFGDSGFQKYSYEYEHIQ